MFSHPWNNIPLEDYEGHMKLDNIAQLQTLNLIMKEQVYQYDINSLVILGVAGGNGLEHIDLQKIKTIYGIDINSRYLDACAERYPELKSIFTGICADITDDGFEMPMADMVIANLLIEYTGLDSFTAKIRTRGHRYVSCVIQENRNGDFVSDSPYGYSLRPLDNIHTDIQKSDLILSMDKTGFCAAQIKEYPLPNGKVFLRIDFKHKS